jgi:hypothetical protein
MSNAYKILIGKPERKVPLERSRHRTENKADINLKKNLSSNSLLDYST